MSVAMTPEQKQVRKAIAETARALRMCGRQSYPEVSRRDRNRIISDKIQEQRLKWRNEGVAV